MGCTDTTPSARAAAASARSRSSVILLDCMVGEAVSTTTTGAGNWYSIPLTGDEVEDLAAYIDEITVTAQAAELTNLTYKVVVEHRTLGGSWEEPASNSEVLAAVVDSEVLKVSSPWAHRENLGRKFRLVLRIQATTSGHGAALMTVSAALRLLT